MSSNTRGTGSFPMEPLEKDDIHVPQFMDTHTDRHTDSRDIHTDRQMKIHLEFYNIKMI